MKIKLTVTQFHELKRLLPYWSSQYDYVCLLDSNECDSACHYDSYELVAGVANIGTKTYNQLQDIDFSTSWKLGYIPYQTNHLHHGITDPKPTKTGFEECFFFEPQLLFVLKKGCLELEISGADATILNEILNYSTPKINATSIQFVPRYSKEAYIKNVEEIKQQIEEGTFYELNYCMEFYQEDAVIDAAEVFQRLSVISPTPFAAFVKHNDKYLVCASPERFIKKTENIIVAQPIKGTMRRGGSSMEDEQLKIDLHQSEKERAENVMIVDLMRNDLAQCAITGTVQLEELFGVYSFATVHQLISTVSATLRNNISLHEILQKTFPMGSMTGAPKREVMHYIDALEPVSRGIFSGCVGYINPENNFDLNVVIRSIIYNETNHYLSCFVGSAITFDADAAAEYDECLLKTRTMFNAVDTKMIVL